MKPNKPSVIRITTSRLVRFGNDIKPPVISNPMDSLNSNFEIIKKIYVSYLSSLSINFSILVISIAHSIKAVDE